MRNFPDPEVVSAQVLEAIGHSGPPTDLDAVCSLWPRLGVAEEDLDQAGYLIPLGVLGAEILIRRNDPPVRKKFTLAHELGHWTLAHLKTGQICFGDIAAPALTLRTQHKRQTPEEVWCNKFAAGILMPAKDVHDYIQRPSETSLPEKISYGASRFQISEEAFLSRISEITPVSVFEVVSAESNIRVQRRFLSKFALREKVEQALGRTLDGFQEINDLPNCPVTSGSYQVETKLTRRSKYGRSWVVTVAPLANVDNSQF